SSAKAPELARKTGLALLTNGIGGMARLQVNLGEIKSKYDCALAANLHPAVPVDRYVFVKRIRVWAMANGFISALNQESLLSFVPGPPARYRQLRVFTDGGEYHHEPEWSTGIFHSIEDSRGQPAHGDAYSPGWFDLPMPKDLAIVLVCTADRDDPSGEDFMKFERERTALNELAVARSNLPREDTFGRQLALA